MEYDTRAGDVTYSPQDDKLRIYFATRQSQETLQPLKDAGKLAAAWRELDAAVGKEAQP